MILKKPLSGTMPSSQSPESTKTIARVQTLDLFCKKARLRRMYGNRGIRDVSGSMAAHESGEMERMAAEIPAGSTVDPFAVRWIWIWSLNDSAIAPSIWATLANLPFALCQTFTDRHKLVQCSAFLEIVGVGFLTRTWNCVSYLFGSESSLCHSGIGDRQSSESNRAQKSIGQQRLAERENPMTVDSALASLSFDVKDLSD
jgi:hypothetical protein